MPYRTFRGLDGLEWAAWDVLPRAIDRRTVKRRTSFESEADAEAYAEAERRLIADRRVTVGRPGVMRSAYAQGWLCFETGAERRRLVPIPVDWHRCAEDVLAQYCAEATPVSAAVLRYTREGRLTR